MTAEEYIGKHIMKTVVIIFILSCFLLSSAYSQEWKIIQGSEVLKKEKDVSERNFLCTNIGCYILFSDRLMISKDGCRTWQRSTLDTQYPDCNFSGIEFFDDFYGIIAARKTSKPYPSFVLRTTDGGATWSNVFTFDKYYSVLLRVSYINSHSMVILAGNHTFNGYVRYDVYKTTDKAITWDSVLSCLNCDVYFKNDDLGFIRFVNPSIGFGKTRLSVVRGNNYNFEGDFIEPDFLIYNTERWKTVFDTMIYVYDQQFSVTDSMKFSSHVTIPFQTPGIAIRLHNSNYGHFSPGYKVHETTDGGLTWKQVFDAYPYGIDYDFYYTPWGIVARGIRDNVFILNETQKNPRLINPERLDIYPNPSSSSVSVTIPSEEVVIYSTLGEALIRVQDKFENIDIQSLSTGYYIVKAVTPIGVYYNSFVKE